MPVPKTTGMRWGAGARMAWPVPSGGKANGSCEREGVAVRVLQNTQARPVAGVSFGPGGRTLVAGGSGGYDVWDLATGAHAFAPSHAAKDLYGCVYDPLG